MGLLTLRPLAGVAFVALLSAACAPAPIRISDAEIARLRGEPEIRVVRYSPEAITVQTRGGDVARQFGLVGLAVGSSVDENLKSKLMKEYGFQDPAPSVRDMLVSALTADLGLTNVRLIEEPAPADAADELRRRFGTGVVLDIKTLVWWLTYDQQAFDAYRLLYVARARLVRLEGPSVIWQATCDRPVGEAKTSKMDELMANGGQLLKQRTTETVDWCARTLLEQFRGR